MRAFSLVLLMAALAVLPAVGAHAEEPPSLAGTWARYVVSTATAVVPIVGTVTNASQALVLLRLTQSGVNLELKETVCAVRVASSSTLVKTVLPKAFARAVSNNDRTARLFQDAAGHWTYHEPTHKAVWGAKLVKSDTDALPTDVHDARVFDGDGDGKPGLTIRLVGALDGEMYVVQRGTSEFTSHLQSGPKVDRIDGQLVWSNEQKVLSATSILLKSPPKASQHPDPKKSYFRSVRVPAGTTCAALLKQPPKFAAQ